MTEVHRTGRGEWQRPIWIQVMLPTLIVLIASVTSARVEQTAFRLSADGTVIDQAGRELPPRSAFSRIISLYGAHTENLFALGLDAAIVGVSPHEDYPPAARTKAVFSYRDDPERFLAVRPDLVLIRPMIDRAYGQLVRRLEQSGIMVVSLQPTGVAQLPLYWQILGQLTGRQAEAAGMWTRFDTAVTAFRALAAQIEAPKRVYFEAMHRQMRTFAPGAMAIFALETAGGINVAADAQVRTNNNIAIYGRERILAHAHEIDLYLAQVGVMNKVTREEIKTAPGFGVIRAVAADEICLIDEKRVSRPTLRLLEGIYSIGRRLYPEHFAAPGAAILAQAGLSVPDVPTGRSNSPPEGGSH
jgi:iron complex transport system substrate-binding protein